jgi:RNA polymerase sigma factor (sigma-70 family)
MTKLRGRYSGDLIHQLEQLFRRGSLTGTSEGELLERFVARRDESAFEALMARHGPMVLGVCRQLLHDPNDIDDAFQATFLVLVRKAITLKRFDLLGNWLYGVAYRVSLRARSNAARRLTHTAPFEPCAEALAFAESRGGIDSGLSCAIDREQIPWLHHEISHLPEKYRVPIVLCYFEGATHDEAAGRLGWSLGTVKGRLARARALLRRRLARRGVAVSLAALASAVGATKSSAAVPAPLEYATLSAAKTVVSYSSATIVTASAVSLPVAALVEGALQAMILNQFKAVALPAILLGSTVLTGLTVAATQLTGRPGQSQPAVAAALSRASAPEAAPSVAQDSGRDFGKAGRSSPRAGAGAPPAQGSTNRASSEGEAFDRLLADARPGHALDVKRLADWSALMLDADLILSSKQADRVEAARAHRDRMKKLSETLQRRPHEIDAPADHELTHIQLQQAERWLESESAGKPIGPLFARSVPPETGGGAMGEMMGMMMRGGLGAQRGMMGGGGMGMMMGGRGRAGRALRGAPPAGGGRTLEPNAAAAAGQEPVGDAVAKGGSGGGQSVAVAGGPGRPGAGASAMSGLGGGMGMGGGMPSGGPLGGMAPGMMSGGMMGMGGGGKMMAALSPEVRDRQLRRTISLEVARLSAHDKNPRSQVILKKLEEPVVMSFPNPTPLDDVLKYIKAASTTPQFAGLPIYVDPKGLEEANSGGMGAPVTVDLEHIPLKTSLRLMLKQLGLAYCVRDGVLIISSVQGIADELAEVRSEEEGMNDDSVGETH